MTDHYELLQISPHADADTIHRVYRFLAARFHPDNPESGDADLFHLVRTAYDVLSNPEQRAEYDNNYRHEPAECVPLSSSVDFMDDLEGELNRRLGLLVILYRRRRTNPDMPEVGLAEIETRMGFPRDYLDFTVWYLTKRGYITRGDNAHFTLTADGVDFVETQRANLPILKKLLTSGSASSSAQAGRITRVPDVVRRTRSGDAGPDQPSKPAIVVPGASTAPVERRANTGDQRKTPYGRRATDKR